MSDRTMKILEYERFADDCDQLAKRCPTDADHWKGKAKMYREKAEALKAANPQRMTGDPVKG